MPRTEDVMFEIRSRVEAPMEIEPPPELSELEEDDPSAIPPDEGDLAAESKLPDADS